MNSDAEIVLERVKSEALGVLMSIQSYRDIAPSYFDRLRSAVRDAVSYFKVEGKAPPALIHELDQAATVLRNEAMAFPGRTAACLEMVAWLERSRQELA